MCGAHQKQELGHLIITGPSEAGSDHLCQIPSGLKQASTLDAHHDPPSPAFDDPPRRDQIMIHIFVI